MPKTSDERRHWRLSSSWPKVDRQRWIAGTSQAHPLDIPIYGQLLAPESIATIERAYGRFLTYLDIHGILDALSPPEDRPTPARIAEYLRHLSEMGYTGQTCLLLLSGLRSAMRILVPENDWRWIVRPGGVSVLSRFRGEVHRTPITVPQSSELYKWGLSIVQGSSAGDNMSVDRFAYRDGLIIALLAARPIRVRTLAGLQLDRSLINAGGVWRLLLRAEDMKNKRTLEQPLPKTLQGFVSSYVDDIRRQLSPSCDHSHLWIGNDGQPMKIPAIGHMIRRRSTMAFGIEFGPHRFRHAAATSSIMADPSNGGLASSMLAIGESMVRSHYDRSDESLAIERFHSALAAERLQLEGVARLTFADRDKTD